MQRVGGNCEAVGWSVVTQETVSKGVADVAGVCRRAMPGRQRVQPGAGPSGLFRVC